MDTSKLKKFAVEARKSLMGIVGAKLDLVLEANSFERRNNPQAIKALEGLIKEIGKEQTIEKVAYTWFNRFIALRFMDVNHYTKIGVVSPAEGQTQPEVLSEAKGGYVDKQVVPAEVEQRISGLLSGAISSPKPQEEVYKLLLVAYCNAYNKLMPFMFERIKDYTELLMPDDLLSNSSVLTQAVETLDAETCKDVEVIGWLYQYYISEKKDQVFAGLKKGKKISKDDVPAATQIFTPEWIVKYMVENSVGKLWLESQPNKELQAKFKYYLESAEQEDSVKAKLKEITNPNLKPQEIKVLDPACGSGHILVKAFEVLFEIYKVQGYPENEIPEMILTHNLFGLEICDRAAQLSQFAVMMKARQYDRNIFSKVKELNICSIYDTNWIDFSIADELLIGVVNKDKATKQIRLLQETFKDAKEYGSILKVEGLDFDFWDERINYYHQKKDNTLHGQIINGRLKYIIKQAKIMQQQYECVVANPPYMGGKGMDGKLSDYVKNKYARSKGDMFAVFKEVIFNFTRENFFSATINQHAWMFIESYAGLREYFLQNATIISMIHIGLHAFREMNSKVIQSTTYVFRKCSLKDFIATYERLVYDSLTVDKEQVYLEHKAENIYTCKTEGFSSIPGSPIAYWASDRVREIFRNSKPVSDYSTMFQGIITGDNEKFLRLWQEVDFSKVSIGLNSFANHDLSKQYWIPYNKGGEYRKWYGNQDTVVYWKYGPDDKTRGKKNFEDFYLREYFSWSYISASTFATRYFPQGFLWDVTGSGIFTDKKYLYYFMALIGGKIGISLLNIINPTLNYQVENVAIMPIIYDDNKKQQIDALVEQNIAISKDDWDSFEASWDFKQHPLIRFSAYCGGLNDSKYLREVEPRPLGDKISECFAKWKTYKEQQFNQVKNNEEELNRLFIEIYGLQDEMTPEVADKNITISKADEEREIKSLISYAVGCMFGRYSLDAKGLIYAGGDFDANNYQTFEADEDGIIPVLSEHYFTDDIVERFNKFIKVAFGERYYAENMAYIASVLSTKANKSPDQVLREYFIKDFYKDHVQMYQKRPIYWMFSSEKNAFNALIYLHRYNKDTVNLVLNEYLREYKNKLQGNIDALTSLENNDFNATIDKIALQADLNEADDYERNILFPLATERKEIDLDDGVKVNYLKFGKALRNIGLKEKA